LRLGQTFFDTKVSEIMSVTPKVIRKSAKIVEAGEMMNHHSIHSLIVVDDMTNDKCQMSNNHVVGVIDSFSCLPGTRFYH
jgi:CBS domain-containing protein